MMAAEGQLLIFEGASAGRYPQRSRPSEQRRNDERREPRRSLRSSPQDEAVGRRRGKNRQMALALRVAEIQAKGHKAFGFVAWHGGQLRWLRGLLARPLLRLRYGSPLRGCSREAALPAAHSFRNGLYAISSAVPYGKKRGRLAKPVCKARRVGARSQFATHSPAHALSSKSWRHSVFNLRQEQDPVS